MFLAKFNTLLLLLWLFEWLLLLLWRLKKKRVGGPGDFDS